MEKIFILGNGVMGLGICQMFLEKKFKVLIFLRRETDENIFKKKLRKKLEYKEKFLVEEIEEMFENISFTLRLEDAQNCDLVVEAIIESLEIKMDYFKKLDLICKKETIFATNTSSLSITEIGSITNRPNQVVGLHFFNPVQIMQLVEIGKGYLTSEIVVKKMVELIEKIGKEGIVIDEIPGLIVNRMLIPMINEAIGIYSEGNLEVEEIDRAMKLGANHPIGPLALADLIGLDICLNIMDVLHKEYGDDKYRAHYLLKKMVRGNCLGRKVGIGFYNYDK